MSNFNYGNRSSGGSSNTPDFNVKRVRRLVLGGVAAVVLILVFVNSFIILDTTERGVIFYKYGSGLDVDHVYSEGLNIVAPWNEMIRTDVSEQQTQEKMEVLSKDGLKIGVEISIRYRPKGEFVGYLYKQFKGDYQERLVIPELRSAVRSVIGNYNPEELYSTKRTEIESKIYDAVYEKLEANHVDLKALLMRNISLPKTLVSAIELKLTEEQNAQKYVYILQQERQEAERKVVAARGEQMANAILDSSLTDKLLKMRGIEATLKLSESPNTKVVVVGGDDGMPLILGNN